MAKIKFIKDKLGVGMYAKDGEYVEFDGHCECSGQVKNYKKSRFYIFIQSKIIYNYQVEKWLNKLTDIMRSSGRQYFSKAVRSYDEKPRRLWIFDYPAQAALCGVQIWWTAETNDAFAQLEIGHENALKEYNKKQVILTSSHKYFIV